MLSSFPMATNTDEISIPRECLKESRRNCSESSAGLTGMYNRLVGKETLWMWAQSKDKVKD